MDSEHSAIFQCLSRESRRQHLIRFFFLQHPAGAFPRGKSAEFREQLRLEDALESSELVYGAKDYG
ncbi:MAG: hypothetical protein ACLVIY_13185 [Anaerobutyricum soehngenii]